MHEGHHLDPAKGHLQIVPVIDFNKPIFQPT